MRPLIAALVCAALAPQDDEPDGGKYVSRENNFALTWPAGWKRVKPPNENFELALHLDNNIIMAAAGESNATPESVLEAVEEDQRMQADRIEETSRKTGTVAGARAVFVSQKVRSHGNAAKLRMAIFCHQGIAYRIVGVHVLGELADFEADFEAVLKSVTFRGDRKEWLARYQGKPARTALLGGLAALELNRPRWTETTFDSNRNWSCLDEASFAFISDGAWIHLQARESTASAEEEMEATSQRLAGTLKKAQKTKGPVRDRACIEIAGEFGDYLRVYRVSALVEDGVALVTWMEAIESRVDETKRDWEQLVGSLSLAPRSKPAEPPAFPCERRGRSNASESVAAWQAKAVRVLESTRNLYGVSPDGRRAILSGNEGMVLRHLDTGRREPLPLDPPPIGFIAFSPDGRSVAYTIDGGFSIVKLSSGKSQKVERAIAEVVFGGGNAPIIGTTRSETTVRAGRVTGNALVGLTLVGDATTLLEYPLARIWAPAASPDGTRVAFAANRDYPRSAAQGGHVYMCGTDGSDLRQLTKDPETVESVSWSADGKSLFVVRRICAGPDGAVGPAGLPDLWRLPLDGAPVNLTRSGLIDRAWTAGEDVLIATAAWGLSDEQAGLWRIAAADLEKIAATRPLPPVPDPARHAKEIAEAVRGSLGGVTVADCVPTEELLARVAEAFASSAGRASGLKLDFSEASLDFLSWRLGYLPLSSDRELALGVGAYYGETLRRAAGAKWKLKPVPFGRWSPAATPDGSLGALAVLPFSEPALGDLGTETGGMRAVRDVRELAHGRTILLVYPSALAAEAMRETDGPDLVRAREFVDAGDVRAALAILGREMERQPRNGELATEAISLCEAAHLGDEASSLAGRAVRAGNQVPQVLALHAKTVARTDRAAALDLYRRAAQEPWVPADILIDLGALYRDTGRVHVAESCWRRAYSVATPAQQAQIRGWLGIPEKP